MEENFNASLTFIEREEGGWSDHPQDTPTKYGITLSTLEQWRAKRLNKEDLLNLTRDEARLIYKSFYWNKVNADKLSSGIDLVVFDAAINQGPGRSVKWLQKVAGAKVDGIVGPKTLERARNKDTNTLLIEFTALRILYWTSLLKFSIFGRGWVRRGLRCLVQALTMVDKYKAQE